jgi:hypothetical protein
VRRPFVSSGDGRAKTVLLFVGGLLATLAAVATLVVLWPDGDDTSVVSDGTTTSDRGAGSPGGTLGEPSERTSTTATGSPSPPAQLFESGAQGALTDMAAAAGDPDQAIEVAVYPTYAFLAYRSPSDPSHIDRRSWRDGEDQDDAAPNPIDDRVDGDTEPALFPLATVDLTGLPALIADAEGRFDLDVTATHVLIDRFLPFDDRVLIRVYASPEDGRSGGGYVQYALDGTFVKVVK